MVLPCSEKRNDWSRCRESGLVPCVPSPGGWEPGLLAGLGQGPGRRWTQRPLRKSHALRWPDSEDPHAGQPEAAANAEMSFCEGTKEQSEQEGRESTGESFFQMGNQEQGHRSCG